MTTNGLGTLRKYLAQFIAATVLVAVYCVGTATVSGIFLTASATSASAQWRGRGWRGRGWGWRGRGWGRRGIIIRRGRGWRW